MLNIDLNIGDHFIFGAAVMVQLCGLITLLASRFCRSDSQAIWNSLFLATLCLVGFITIISIRQESGHWLVSSSTLAIMVVGATIGSGGGTTRAATI